MKYLRLSSSSVGDFIDKYRSPATREIVVKYVPDADEVWEKWGRRSHTTFTIRPFCEKCELGEKGDQMIAELLELDNVIE